MLYVAVGRGVFSCIVCFRVIMEYGLCRDEWSVSSQRVWRGAGNVSWWCVIPLGTLVICVSVMLMFYCFHC